MIISDAFYSESARSSPIIFHNIIIRKKRIFIIKITQKEADYIISCLDCNKRKLQQSSKRKKSGGKTYYVLNDDINSLRVLARLRGYINSDCRNDRDYFSAIRKLLSEN